MSSYRPMIDQIADEVITDDDYIVPMKLEDWHRDLSDYCHPNTLEYSEELARMLRHSLEAIESYEKPDIDILAEHIGYSIIDNVIMAGIKAKHLEKI